jgi:hypothetical protein
VRFIDSVSPLAPRLAQFDRPGSGLHAARPRAAGVAVARPRQHRADSLPRDNRAIGVIAFGSRDPQRFTHDLAADFLAHLGRDRGDQRRKTPSTARACCAVASPISSPAGTTGATFHNRCARSLARAERTGKALACLMIDVDHFKDINDRFGHLAGDEALKEVARRAEAEIRAGDTGCAFRRRRVRDLAGGRRVRTRV